MEGLSFDNILGEQEIETLFTDPNDTETQEDNIQQEEEDIDDSPTDGKGKKKEKTTEVINPETLFEDDIPESVGSGKNKEGKKEDTVHDDDQDGTSPDNFYSSIANALAVDGIFPNLDEETVKKAVDAETFSNLIESETAEDFKSFGEWCRAYRH